MIFPLRLRTFGGVVALAVIFIAFAPTTHAQIPELADKGITLTISRKDITVSGISSGAAMAHQLHIARSRDIAGAGMVAGPPYRCADYFKGNIAAPFTNDIVAMNLCTAYFKKFGIGNPITAVGASLAIKLPRLQALADEAFQSGRIDPKSGLCGDRVFLIAGGKDDTVPGNVTKATKELYEWLLSTCNGGALVKPSLSDVAILEMPHTMPVDGLVAGRNCVSGAPYIADCDFAGGEHILKFLYPAKAAAAQANRLASPDNLFRFNQYGIIGAFQPKWLMHQFGYIYVPESCQRGMTCSLHVAFHGCHQNENQINEGSNNPSRNDLFAKDAGYNQFAERNNLVVLYPQVDNTSQIGVNPAGCWDWWGYNGPDFYQKGAGQIQNVWKIVQAVF